jgi:hypothetical protein
VPVPVPAADLLSSFVSVCRTDSAAVNVEVPGGTEITAVDFDSVAVDSLEAAGLVARADEAATEGTAFAEVEVDTGAAVAPATGLMFGLAEAIFVVVVVVVVAIVAGVVVPVEAAGASVDGFEIGL